MIQIAIDGASACGKSAIAKKIAQKIDGHYINTGLLYRAITFLALQQNLPIKDLIPKLNLAFQLHDNILHVTNHNEVINQELLDTYEIEKEVSNFAKDTLVREYLLNIQRNCTSLGNIVMEGRDIASTILPNATYKFFIETDIKTRAIRRQKQRYDIPLSIIEEELIRRDLIDATRKISPLVKVKDAIIIDNSSNDLNQTIMNMLSYIDL